jgi:cathepsin D
MRSAIFLALVPALVSALPHALKGPDFGNEWTIQLSRLRSIFSDDRGVVDVEKLTQYIQHVEAKYSDSPDIAKRSAIALDNGNFTVWTGEIEVGTPPKKFAALFDTGSFDFVVPVAPVESHEGVVYDPASSSSSKALDKPFTLQYGSGDVSGMIYNDTVSIGGITATSQTILAANVSDEAFFGQMNALVGLSFASVSTTGNSPLVQTLRSEGRLPSPVFGFKLNDTGSELSFGSLNKKLYKGKPTYVPVSGDKYWQVEFEKMTLWDKDVTPKVKTAIIDSGTSLILADEASVDTFYDSVYGSLKNETTGLWEVMCYNIPTINVTFGGMVITVPTDVFTLGQLAPHSMYCLGGIQATTLPYWIMGDTLMRNVYTIFDAAKKRVGFAPLA